MINTPIPFGVQSFCFRHFKDNRAVARMVREIGLDSIELCAVHADFNDPKAFAEVNAVYRDEGVSILSLGVQTYHGDDGERRWFECAAIAGAQHLSAHLRVDTHARAIPRLRAWCREFGLRLGIHCHGGYMFGGSPDVISHLIGLGGPEIGLCIDTAWAMQIGPHAGNPVSWVEKFGPSVYGIHFKDFLFEPNGQWKDVVVGTGNLDLPAFTKALTTVGFKGMAVIEYEAEVENPVPALGRCVQSMQAAMAATPR